jgi:hypothetical protein
MTNGSPKPPSRIGRPNGDPSLSRSGTGWPPNSDRFRIITYLDRAALAS